MLSYILHVAGKMLKIFLKNCTSIFEADLAVQGLLALHPSQYYFTS